MGAKRKRQYGAQSADLGTPEGQSRRDLEIAPRVQLESGMVVSFGARVTEECLLDTLLRNGTLGQHDDAHRRYDAGIDLRELHQTAQHFGAVVSSYQVACTGGRQEMSDAQADAHGAWSRRIQKMQGCGTVVTSVCCHDEPVPTHQVGVLIKGLDLLSR